MLPIHSTKLTKEEFIKKSIKRHGDVYDYSKSVYEGTFIDVIIICKVHGEFSLKPADHIRRFAWGAIRGCPNCKIDNKLSKIIDACNIAHNSKYDYSSVGFYSMNKKVDIICPTHGIFRQRLDNHLHNACGCPACSKTGFDKNKPAICYYIKFETEEHTLYKIGITNRSVKKRLVGMKLYEGIKATIIQELRFEDGKDALIMETKILKEFEEFKYQGMPIMDNGNSELFTKDILNLNI